LFARETVLWAARRLPRLSFDPPLLPRNLPWHFSFPWPWWFVSLSLIRFENS
jgi:hypothetical protein